LRLVPADLLESQLFIKGAGRGDILTVKLIENAPDSVLFSAGPGNEGPAIASGAGLSTPGGGQAAIQYANFDSLVDSGFGGLICSMLCSNFGGTYKNIMITNSSPSTTASQSIQRGGRAVIRAVLSPIARQAGAWFPLGCANRCPVSPDN
jgi:hypothetical protein